MCFITTNPMPSLIDKPLRIRDHPLFAKPRAYSTVLFIARSDATTVNKNYFIYFTSLIRLRISMSMRNDIRVVSFTSDFCRVLCQSSLSSATEDTRIGKETFPQHRNASVNLQFRAFVTCCGKFLSIPSFCGAVWEER